MSQTWSAESLNARARGANFERIPMGYVFGGEIGEIMDSLRKAGAEEILSVSASRIQRVKSRKGFRRFAPPRFARTSPFLLEKLVSECVRLARNEDGGITLVRKRTFHCVTEEAGNSKVWLPCVSAWQRSNGRPNRYRWRSGSIVRGPSADHHGLHTSSPGC